MRSQTPAQSPLSQVDPMTTDRHACGLSSFLPMSCRGRAEAFARRLQTRLQSLGRQPSDEPNDSEESWLTTSQHYPTSHQPRHSNSSESDIYFDFDVEFGSPGSPLEEATESDHIGIHLNRRRDCECIPEGQDHESGCATESVTATATSSGSDDSSENNYYDPEAFDFTKAQFNDDLSALIDSTLQESCSHVQCNGYEGRGTCFDCCAVTMTTDNAMTTTIDDAIPTTIDNAMSTTTDNAMTTTIDDAMTTTIDNAMTTTTDNAMTTTIDNAMSTTTEDAMPTTIDNAMSTTIDNAMSTTTEDAIPTTIDDAMTTTTDNVITTTTDNVNTQEEEKADTDMSTVCKENGAVESQSNESKESSACTPKHEATTDETKIETRNETLTTSSCLSASLDVTENAGLGHYCVRVRKPRKDHTKCNGFRHENSLEIHDVKAGTHQGNTETHEVKAEARQGDTETREVKAEAHQGNTETHEVKAEAHQGDTETHEGNTESHEMKAETHEGNTESHEMNAETHEGHTEIHEVKTGTHEARAETHAIPEDTQEATAIGREVEGDHTTEINEPSTELHEAETHTDEAVTAEQEVGSSEAAEVSTSHVFTSEGVLSGDGDICVDRYCSSLSVSSHELLVECPITADTSLVPDVEITVVTDTSKEASPTEVKPKDEEASRKLDVDDIDDEERPQRVRRCSSLKTGKTPPGTPGRKKIVRFADVLGLDLADVRTFLDEVPKVPMCAYEDLVNADLSLGSSSSMSALAAAMGSSMPKPDKTLVPLFAQPGGCADFLDRVREQQVCLENAIVSDVMLVTISGTVRVRNLDFYKSVHIRYSVDGWVTFSDLQASYVQNSCDGFSDTFRFILYAHTLTVGQRLEFAVRFQCHGCQYWDSNRGANYAFQCLPPAGQQSFRTRSMTTCPDEQWASFY